MSKGLDPTLGAILPLVGVALGVLLGGLARHVLDRRAERRSEAAALRAAARIVYDDLWRMGEVLKNSRSTALDDEHRRARLTSAAWEQTRTTLARDYHAWNAARNAVLQVEVLLDTYRASKLSDRAKMDYANVIEPTVDRIEEAKRALEPLGAGVVERRWWPWWPRKPARVL